MELVTATTSFAQWLNSFFEAYDYAILDFLNTLAISRVGWLLTPVMKVISLLGEHGLIFYLLAAGLALFPKTRKTGVCVFGAVCCGALITNIILKDMVARPRPFEANEVFRSFWDAVGSPLEEGFSFPSGHATSAAAGMVALCWARGKKFVLPSILWIGLTMLSRNYLVAHYPSDVLAGVLIGVFSATVAWLITLLIFKILENNKDKAFFRLLLCFGLGGSASEEEEEDDYEDRPTRHGTGRNRRPAEEEDIYEEPPVQRRNVKSRRVEEDEGDSRVFRREKRVTEEAFSELSPRKARSGEYKGRHEK